MIQLLSIRGIYREGLDMKYFFSPSIDSFSPRINTGCTAQAVVDSTEANSVAWCFACRSAACSSIEELLMLTAVSLFVGFFEFAYMRLKYIFKK